MPAPRRSNWLRRFHTGTAVIALHAVLGSIAMAEETAPGFLKDLPVESVGSIVGMPAWKLGEDDYLWMAMPDGTVIAGYVFDPKGQDIGSALIGASPVNVWETLGLPAPTDAGAEGGMSPVASWDTMVADPSGAPAEPADLPALDIETAQISGQSAPEAAPEPGPGPAPSVTPEAAPPTEDPLMGTSEAADDLLKDALAVTETTLANLPEEQKRELVAKLVLSLEAAKTPEEFQLAIIRWNEEATGKKLLPDGFELPSGDVTVPADAAAAPTSAPSVDPIAEERVDPAHATNDSLLADIRTNGFWFGVGAADAPTVYMIADPACPYCARSIKNLSAEIEAGKLQLRVLLAPFVSKNSPDLIAGIMLSEDPAKAYFEHSLQYADRGASDLKQQAFKDLPSEVIAAVRGNYDMVGAYGLRGVPFFAWTTAEGAKLFNGVPNAGHFAAAIKDDYAGNRSKP